MKRIGFIDILRALAIVAVVVIHATFQIEGKLGAIPAGDWWFAAGLNALSRFAVPVFVMISGYLTLAPSSEGIKSFYSKRFTRLLLPALAYFVLYGWWGISTGVIPDLKTYLIRIFVYGSPYGPLYYIYVIAGLTLFAPFLQKLIRQLSQREFSWRVILTLGLASFWEMTTSWFTQSWSITYLFSTTWFLPFVGYYLLGYYIRLYPPKMNRVTSLILFVVSWLLILMSKYILISLFGVGGRGFMVNNYLNPLIILQSWSLFVLVSSYVGKIPRLALWLSSLSFGIYFSHQLVLNVLAITTTSPLSILWSVMATVSISGLVTYLLSRIPYVRAISGVK